MTRQTRLALLSLLLIVPALAHAQGGCVNSPENPTAVLFLVGTAGATAASIRRRLRSRR